MTMSCVMKSHYKLYTKSYLPLIDLKVLGIVFEST